MPRPKKWPQVLKRDSVTVKIHRSVNKDYESFTVVFTEGGKRRRVVRNGYDDAKDLADEKLVALASGLTPEKQLNPDDREVYLAAKKKVEPFKASINEALQEWAEAKKALNDRVGLAEVVRYYLAHAQQGVKDISVQEAYDLYLARIESQKSDRYIEAMKLHLGRFKDTFHCQLNDVTHEQIEAWMDDRGMKARYFNNCRAALITFFKYCRKRRFLPGDLETEAEKIEKRSEIQQAVHIFSPEVITQILAEIRQDLVPYLVLSAFGGLRPSEARRLDWSDIHWDGKDKHIEIHATVARKTLRDRFVPLQPNLKAWLLPYRQERGLVAGFKRSHEMLTRAIKDLEFLPDWPNDVLRHSYGSYRLAVLDDISKVASEMGNSPQVIVHNYRRPVSKADGKRWFRITPA